MKQIFQTFVDRAIKHLSSDSRFCGIAIAGSWISNEVDEFSDLDLIFVSNDHDFASVTNDRIEITKALGAYVSSFTGEHIGEPRVLICLFREPLIHVDIKFVALADFGDRIENPIVAWEIGGKLSQILKDSHPQELRPDPQWIEDCFWTWVHYGAVKIARGEIFEVMGFLSFLREKVIGPLALWQHGKPVRGVRRIETYLPDFSRRLQETLPSYDKASCFVALLAIIDLYTELRADPKIEGLTINDQAQRESLIYLAKVRNQFGSE
jgi:hypothetical protein